MSQLPEMKGFMTAMQTKIDEHKNKHDELWQECDLQFLVGRLYEEFLELVESNNPEEAVNVANIAYLVWAKLQEEHGAVSESKGGNICGKTNSSCRCGSPE